MRVLFLKLKNKLLRKLANIRLYDLWYLPRINKIMSLNGEELFRRGIRRRVRLISNFPGLWQRTIEQTPDGSCQWGGSLFVADGEADYYVILNSIFYPEKLSYLGDIDLSRTERVFGLHMEPEDYIFKLKYNTIEEHKLTSRFYTNSEKLIGTSDLYVRSPPYVHFHSGKSWSFLDNVKNPEKEFTIGLVTSDLSTLAGHEKRLDFVRRIDGSGVDCKIWGRGDNLLEFKNYKGFLLNKWDAHSRCMYSIVIENSVSPEYWSEKFADAILGYSLPLYFGATDLEKYFPARSFVRIDIESEDCIEYIKKVVSSDLYLSRLPFIKEARKIILEKENLYSFLDREICKNEASPRRHS
jgi:hypothetical protein